MAEGRLHLMDPQTFEQEEVAADMFGSAAAFLVPDIIVTLNLAPDGKAVSGVACNPNPVPQLAVQQCTS